MIFPLVALAALALLFSRGDDGASHAVLHDGEGQPKPKKPAKPAKPAGVRVNVTDVMPGGGGHDLPAPWLPRMSALKVGWRDLLALELSEVPRTVVENGSSAFLKWVTALGARTPKEAELILQERKLNAARVIASTERPSAQPAKSLPKPLPKPAARPAPLKALPAPKLTLPVMFKAAPAAPATRALPPAAAPAKPSAPAAPAKPAPTPEQSAARALDAYVRGGGKERAAISRLQYSMGVDTDGLIDDGGETQRRASALLGAAVKWPHIAHAGAAPGGDSPKDAALRLTRYVRQYHGSHAERVKAYQRVMGVEQAGTVGPKTKARVKELTGVAL